MWRIFVMAFLIAFTFTGCTPGTGEHMKNGVAKCEKKDHKGAIADYTLAVEADPALDSAYFYRGRCRQHLGEYKGAIQDFEKAAELNPKS